MRALNTLKPGTNYKMIPTIKDLSDTCPVRSIIKPGDYLYVFCYDFYVKTKVYEVQYIWAAPGESSLWHSVYDPGEHEGTGDTFFDNSDTSNGEWGSYVETPDLSGMQVCNQLPWTEFPVGGHAAYVGDDSFFTLDEARKCYGRFRAKKKHRRAKNYLSIMRNYLRNDDYPPRKYFYRKVYV